MVKNTTPVAKKEPSIIPNMGGKDIIGQKPLIKKLNNNYIYGGLGLMALVGGYIISNPRLLGMLMGQKPQMPGATVTAQSVQPGAAVTITGTFNPPVPQAYYNVTDSNGNQITNGSLGSNVSTFSQQLPSQSWNTGSYTVTVSDSPSQGAASGPSPGSIAGGAPGSVYPTAATLQQGLQNNQLGASQSGPESIALT